MKERDHISEGDLELYLLDVLSREERQSLENHFHDTNVLEEKNSVEETLELLARKEAREPAAELRSKILADVAKSNSRVVSTPSRFMMAASISLTLVVSAVAYFFWNNWQTTESQLEAVLKENTYLADQATFTNQKIEELQEGLGIISNPDFQQIQLKGLENYPDYLTRVYWNAGTKETFLQVSNLGELNKGQQYQLWSIQDGKPVDSGVFDLDDQNALIKMKPNELPQAFAITIEPTGGSQSPTLENMVVIGNVEV